MRASVFLQPGKERKVAQRHPWIFSGSIARATGSAADGTVDILRHDGRFLARGYYNPRSQIAVRIWTLHDEPIDQSFFGRRLSQAIATRASLGLTFNAPQCDTTAFRLINAEADQLPGLIVDAYGPYLVLQVLTWGMEQHKTLLVDQLMQLLQPAGVFERSDVEVRHKEGLAPICGPLAGAAPPPQLEIQENGLRFLVDLHTGHKTGFYLDQRQNRGLLAHYLGLLPPSAQPFSVLNAFSYSGAFGVYAASAHSTAHVLNLDSSGPALEAAKQNFAHNELVSRAEYQVGDAFVVLRQLRDKAQHFHLVILDPPKFAQGKSQLNRASRGYKDLNLLAIKLLHPGGYLATFSCSGAISGQLFTQIVFAAATDAGRTCRIMQKLGQGADHPLLLSFPEGEYLKGLLLQVVD